MRVSPNSYNNPFNLSLSLSLSLSIQHNIKNPSHILTPLHKFPLRLFHRQKSKSNMSALGVSFSVIFLMLLFLSNMFNYTEGRFTQANGSFRNQTAEEEEGGMMVPVMEEGMKMEMMVMMNDSRRQLRSFQICALCTCCGGAKGLCLPSPCCYAINCNIPNRPFGFCSFTPKTCNCFGCHI